MRPHEKTGEGKEFISIVPSSVQVYPSLRAVRRTSAEDPLSQGKGALRAHLRNKRVITLINTGFIPERDTQFHFYQYMGCIIAVTKQL